MESHTENKHQKLVPDNFLILLIDPKRLWHAINHFKKIFSKRIIEKL